MRPCCFHQFSLRVTGGCVLGFYLALVSCGSDDAPAGASKTLSWTAVPEPSVVGYKLYYGTSSGQYDSQVDVGPDVSYTVNGLTPGTTYYFAVSAYNSGGESALSSEVSSFVEETEAEKKFRQRRSDS
jgi:fibronectin type III domain protein